MLDTYFFNAISEDTSFVSYFNGPLSPQLERLTPNNNIKIIFNILENIVLA